MASTPRDDENILQYRVRLESQRIVRCGIYQGAKFCTCGNELVNHPVRKKRKQVKVVVQETN